MQYKTPKLANYELKRRRSTIKHFISRSFFFSFVWEILQLLFYCSLPMCFVMLFILSSFNHFIGFYLICGSLILTLGDLGLTWIGAILQATARSYLMQILMHNKGVENFISSANFFSLSGTFIFCFSAELQNNLILPNVILWWNLKWFSCKNEQIQWTVEKKNNRNNEFIVSVCARLQMKLSHEMSLNPLALDCQTHKSQIKSSALWCRPFL